MITRLLLQPFHQVQHTSNLQESPACYLRWLLRSQAQSVQTVPRPIVNRHGFFSEGLLVPLATGTGIILRQLGTLNC
jgi:hypothetical protein